MKLYADYIKEREGIELIYDDNCFLSYKELDKETIFIIDIYSTKQVRGKGVMLEFCNTFMNTIKDQGYTVVFGQTDESTNGWENSDRLLKKYGFKYIGKDPNNEKLNNYCKEL